MKHRYKHRPAAPPLPVEWLLTLLLALLPTVTPVAAADEPPSAALLEFLGELEPLDDETWALIEQHAQRDLEKEDEVQNQ